MSRVTPQVEMAYEALHSLQQALKRILEHDDDLMTRRVKLQIICIHDKAVVLALNIKDFPEKERIRDVADTTEDYIGYLFSKENLSDCGSMEPSIRLSNQLRKVAKKLESTAGDVVDYFKVRNSQQKRTHPNTNDEVNSPAVSSSSRRAPTATSKDLVVGFDEDLKVIKDRLLEGSSKLQVLPIVGIGGIGKTTLAKLVYNDELIMNSFSIHAWVTISQDYSVASIILNLLASMKGISAERDVERDISMDSLIRKHLKGKRYLIVIDDMCSKKAWDDVKELFPDEGNGSRIMLTTRLQDVAAYVDSSSSMHMMRLLEAHHSWNLLKHKVFADEKFPFELEDIGKTILKNCGGLPLSIVVAAGILSKIRQTRYLWKQIAANDVELETIISSSYTHLPDCLRACFLYMAGFPEDYEIHVVELIKLWVAEGFIKLSNESKSLEEEGEDCLEDLAERSLVLVTSKKFDGKIKSCSLHDIVRDFCVRQASKEKVILPAMDYLPTPILRRHFLPRLIKDHPRISATSYDLHLKDYMHSSNTHTLICIPKKGYRPVGSVEKFNSLRVLHVLRRRDHWDWEPGQLFNLIHLTYLASNIPTSIVPPAISKLKYLQTLIIYRSGVRLPVEIWRLRQLRHLVALSFDPLPHPEEEVYPLENLQSLSLAMDFVCSERMVQMIPNITKMGICYSNISEKFSEYHLNSLEHLSRLEKLKLVVHEKLVNGFYSYGRSLVFPRLLKSLTLSNCGLEWSEMTIIGSLPNLQVLKLRNYACVDRSWKTNEGEFGELRILVIDKSGLRYWTTESSHFPRLECLMLHHCRYLDGIPNNIGDIPTLKLIEVDDQPEDHVRWAKQIKAKKRDSGNDSFQVRVREREVDDIFQLYTSLAHFPDVQDIFPQIVHQLGSDKLENLKMLAEGFQHVPAVVWLLVQQEMMMTTTMYHN